MKVSSLCSKSSTVVSLEFEGERERYDELEDKTKRKRKGMHGWRVKGEKKREKKNYSPTILMRLNQLIRLLPREQIHHQPPQPGPFPDPFLPKHRARIIRRGHRVRPIRHPRHGVHDPVLATLDGQLVREQPELDEPEVRRVVDVEFLVVQRARVHPLHEVLEVRRARGGEVHGGGGGLAEGVGRVQARGEEGGGGGEGFAVHVERLRVGPDGDGEGRFEEAARRRFRGAGVGARERVFGRGRGGVQGSAAAAAAAAVVVVAAAGEDGRHLPGWGEGYLMRGGVSSCCCCCCR